MELWTKEHALVILPAFAIELVLAIVLGKLLKNKSEKIRLIPIGIIGAILLVLEVLKQIIWGFGGDSYTLYAIPLHFCSLFLYVYPLTFFIKGRLQNAIRNITIVCGATLTLLMLVYPVLIFSASDITEYFTKFISFHTVTFHLLAVFGFMLMLSLNLHQFKTKEDCLSILIGFSGYSLIAAIMANILKTNFNSFYYFQVDAIDSARQSIVNALGGRGQLLYVIVVWLIVVAVCMMCYWLVRLGKYIVNKISNKIHKKQSN